MPAASRSANICASQISMWSKLPATMTSRSRCAYSAQVLRHRDPALLVGRDLDRAGEERAGGLALRAPRLARLAQLRGDAVELGDGVHGEASVQRSCHDRTPLELVPKPDREDHPTLRVEGVLELPQEHGLNHLSSVGRIFPPLPSTRRHLMTQSSTTSTLSSPFAPLRCGGEGTEHDPEEEPCPCGSAEAAFRNAPGIPTKDP